MENPDYMLVLFYGGHMQDLYAANFLWYIPIRPVTGYCLELWLVCGQYSSKISGCSLQNLEGLVELLGPELHAMQGLSFLHRYVSGLR